MFLFSLNAERVVVLRELVTEPGTRHVHLSDQDEPDAVPVKLLWKSCVELSPEMLVELVHTYMERPENQRISVSALQMFIGLYKEEEIIACADNLLDAAQGTPHIVSLCTLRYVPSSFMHWSTVDKINKHIMRRHQEGSLPMLMLHKTFYSRQANDWVVCGGCFSDYVDGSSLGSSFSDVGMCRFRSHIISFHSHMDKNIAVVREVANLSPLPLWETFQYSENEFTAEILVSLGYKLKTRASVAKEKKAAKKQIKKSAEAAAAVAAVVAGHMQRRADEVQGANGGPAVGKQRGRRQERGRKRARSWDADKVSVNRPSGYQLMSIDSSTFRSMVSQIGDLKDALKQANKKVEEVEDKLRRRDNSVVKLTGLKEKLQSEVSITLRSEKATEFRCREAEKYIARQSERHFRDMEDWKEAQEDWKRERRELEAKLEAAEDKVRAQGLKMAQWEAWVERQCPKPKKK